MRLFRRFHRRLGSARDVVLVAGALCGFLVANLGLPLVEPVSLATAQKDKSKPFPCQDRPCGCMSADACMRSCCCFTASQRLAWAKAHDVEPIPELIAAAKQETAAASQHAAHDACEHETGCEHCEQTQMAGRSLPTARAKCCSSKAAAPLAAHPVEPAATQDDDDVNDAETADSGWRVVLVVGSLASKCQGLGPLSPLSFPTLPPVPTVDYLYDWCSGEVVPCDQPHLLSASHQPPTRPPCC